MSNVDISGYLVNRFNATYRNENWRFDCPICGADKERFSVSIKKGVVHCWKCEYTNSLIGFVCDYESVEIPDAFRIIRKYVKIRTKSGPRDYKEVPLRPQKIKGYIKLHKLKQSSAMVNLAKKYLFNRGLTESDIYTWQLGISNSEEYAGRIISPFIENGDIIYFVARKFIGPGPKYKNPPVSEYGFGKAQLLYNYENAMLRAPAKGIVIVEGVYDVYAVGKNAVALLGKHASTYQISKIIMMNPAKIDIMLDSDAIDNAIELAKVFSGLFPTNIIKLKKGDPAYNRVTNNNNKEVVQCTLRELVRSKLTNQQG